MSDERKQEKGITLRRGPGRLLPRPEEFERFFDWPFRGFGPWRHMWRRWPRLGREEQWPPDIDAFEREGQIVVRADLPGMKPEEIEVSVEADALVIRGRREAEKEVKEEDYYCCERTAGEFARAISLPEGVDPDSVEAHYDNGVLEVKIKRPAPAEAKKVRVQVK